MWKFDQAENIAATTDQQVIQENVPVFLVIHYNNDESRVFL